MIHNLLGDLSVGLDNNLVDLEGGLDGAGLFVDPVQLLEGAALGLDAVGREKLLVLFTKEEWSLEGIRKGESRRTRRSTR